MPKSKRIYTQLCASCAEKMSALYRLHETPPEYARGGYGKCGLCDFRGALTEYSYDPQTDKRTQAERKRRQAEKAATAAQARRGASTADPALRDYAFTAADFAALDKALADS